MAKGHKKIAGSYCYKGNGCTGRFCEFCSNGDKYEEIEDKEIKDESYLENQYSTNETIKERIDKLIKTYQMYIDKNNSIIVSKKDRLIRELNDASYENIQLNAKDINARIDENDLLNR